MPMVSIAGRKAESSEFVGILVHFFRNLITESQQRGLYSPWYEGRAMHIGSFIF
jgi:hypothetical protein